MCLDCQSVIKLPLSKGLFKGGLFRSWLFISSNVIREYSRSEAAVCLNGLFDINSMVVPLTFLTKKTAS
jgi:hypothetical protein